MSFLPGVQKSILVVVVVMTGEGIKGMVQASPMPVREWLIAWSILIKPMYDIKSRVLLELFDFGPGHNC